MPSSAIEVRGVSKDFLLPHLRERTIKSRVLNAFRRRRVLELQHALRDIDIDVSPGEFLGVVGRNGSGKSTLLKILAGIYQPTAGSVSVKGRLVPFIELGVGFNPELTGRENVYLNGALLGFSKPDVDEIYDDVVAFAELSESMDQKLKFYSSGMHVRIAFSIATHAKADILLIDEVLAVGDAAFQRKCFEHFRALKKSDTTIVLVTHDMGAVREFCDRAILIEDSRILAEGDPEDIAEQYTKLFNPPAAVTVSKTASEQAAKRWGQGDVRLTSVKGPGLVTHQSELVIALDVVAERDVEGLVCGFVVTNSAGRPVMGSNSVWKKQPLGALQRGEKATMTWQIPNIFSDGVHTVDLAVADQQGMVIYDWWNEALSFTVVKDEKTPYLVTADTRLTFSRLDE